MLKVSNFAASGLHCVEFFPLRKTPESPQKSPVAQVLIANKGECWLFGEASLKYDVTIILVQHLVWDKSVLLKYSSPQFLFVLQ